MILALTIMIFSIHIVKLYKLLWYDPYYDCDRNEKEIWKIQVGVQKWISFDLMCFWHMPIITEYYLYGCSGNLPYVSQVPFHHDFQKHSCNYLINVINDFPRMQNECLGCENLPYPGDNRTLIIKNNMKVKCKAVLNILDIVFRSQIIKYWLSRQQHWVY